ELGAIDLADAPVSSEQHGLVLFLLGADALWAGASGLAGRYLRRALASARGAGRDYVAVGALGHLALLELIEGRVYSADELAREALGIADEHGWSGTPQAAAATFALGWCELYACSTSATVTLDRAASAAAGSTDAPLQVA